MAKVLIPDYFGQQILAGIRVLNNLGDRCDLAWQAESFLTSLFHSKALHQYHTICTAQQDNAQYIDDILSLCKQYQYDYLLPFGLSAYNAISCHADKLTPYTKFMVANYNQFQLANDKLKTVEFCQQHDIACPQTFFDYQENDIKAIAKQINYPAVVKSRSGFHSKAHLYFVETPEALYSAYMKIQADNDRVEVQPLIQEFIPGYIHDACTLSVHGEPRTILTQVRYLMYPISGGSGALNITTHDSKLAAEATKLLTALNWHGPAQLEFKYDSRDKQYKLIEINPKLWGTLDLSIKAGVNFPKLIRNYLVEDKLPEKANYPANIAYKFLFSQCSLAWAETAYRLGIKQVCHKQNFNKTYYDFDWRDPLPDIYRAAITVKNLLSRRWAHTPALDKKWINHPENFILDNHVDY